MFSGGGSLGAVQVGMLQCLLAHDVQPDLVVGASVGAMNAAWFAFAPSVAGVEDLAGIWQGLRRSDIFPIGLSLPLGLLWHPGNVISAEGLRRLVDERLPGRRIEEAELPLHIMATNQQGQAIRLSSGPVAEAIMASTAIPGLFPLVEIDEDILMDGAVAGNTPLRLAVELGASRIIILPTGYACALKEPPATAIGRMLHAITLMTTWQSMRELELLPETIEVHLAPTLCPLSVSPFDFSQSRELIERAARTCGKWITAGGLTRRASPRELTPHRHGRRA